MHLEPRQPKSLFYAAACVLIFEGCDQKEADYLLLKRKLMNKFPYSIKHSLLKKFLSDKSISQQDRINCLEILLEERTTDFNFILWPIYEFTNFGSNLRAIFRMIINYAPNIETIDLLQFRIIKVLTEDFKNLLRKCKKLKSLRVKMYPGEDCVISKLLIEEDFESFDLDLQIGIQKIEYIYLRRNISAKCCARLFELLPNLKGFEKHTVPIGSALNYYLDSNHRLLNITKIQDSFTSTVTLENIVKICPKLEFLELNWPYENVVESLWRIPTLKRLELHNYEPNELYYFLLKAGEKLESLKLYNEEKKGNIDKKIVNEFCPKIEICEMHVVISLKSELIRITMG